jgi:type I restriction enzyme, S subunit
VMSEENGSSKLASIWRQIGLGEIADFVMGQAPPGNECNFEGKGTIFVKAGEFGHSRPVVREWTTKPLKFAQRGDVLICVVGATAGKLNLAIDCAIGRSVAAIRPFGGITDRFILFQLQPKVLELRSSTTGSAQGVISKDDLSGIEIVLPPLPEQHRIVAKLEELFTKLDAGVEALRKAQAQLKRYRQAVLKAAVTGELTKAWREAHQGELEPASALLARILRERREKWEAGQLAKMEAVSKTTKNDDWKKEYLEPTAPVTSELPDLPEGWVWASIRQLTTDALIGLDRGKAYQRKEAIGSPYVKMNNVTMDGKVKFEDLVFVSASDEERTRFSIQSGDLLFNTRNSLELVGKVGLVRNPPADAIYNNNLMRIRLAGEISPSFICSEMCEPEFRRRLEKAKRATTNVAAVYAKDLFPLALALAPLAEQQQIVLEVERLLSIADATEQTIEQSLKQAERLRQSILNQAFAGKLVPQDPSDEPAEVLLARIRGERERRAAARPKRGEGRGRRTRGAAAHDATGRLIL